VYNGNDRAVTTTVHFLQEIETDGRFHADFTVIIPITYKIKQMEVE
jgi:hypothetical protein